MISNSIVSRLNIRINEAAIQTNNMTGKKVEKSADFEASSGPFNTKLSCCICSKIELVAPEQIAKTANAFRLLRTVFQIFFFRHPSPLPFVVSIFRRHLHSTRPYYALRRSHFFAAISIAAMLTQLHLKNAPKFVSLFAGDAAAARENMSKISREKMERQGSAFDCLQLS